MATDSTTHTQAFADRLRRARLMRGLSQREVAERLAKFGKPLSHASIQKYEKAQMGPNSDTLIALARVFDVEPAYFFRSNSVTLGTIEFRKQSSLPKKEINRIREEARDFFEKYLEIEQILDLPKTSLPLVDLSKLAASDMSSLQSAVEAAAESVRKEWQLGDVPLVNVRELLEERGIKVVEAESDERFNGFSGWTEEKIPVIALAKWLDQDLPRKRLTALHELGHLALQFPPDLPLKEQESLCFYFAAAMLIPAHRLRQRVGTKRSDGVSYPERLGIKEDWGISMAALMRRVRDLDIITASQYKSFCYLNRNNRKEESGHWHGSETADRYEQLVWRALSQELITRSKAAELLGLPLRQLDALRHERPA